ncbi:MAG: hypothetical protein WCP64_03690 [Actinomycetes bacterium]
MMAISQLAPNELTPSHNSTRSRRPNFLKLAPEFEIFSGERTDRAGFIAILIGIFLAGLISLLVINTLLTQDAFVLQRLKIQTNLFNDQRDAIVQLVAKESSPEHLAAAATKLGMIPAVNPEFLDLNAVSSQTVAPASDISNLPKAQLHNLPVTKTATSSKRVKVAH